LGQIKAPTYSAQHLARIKALEEESKEGALVSDPLFQAQRAQLVQGGQEALSGVENVQRAQGTSGGFRDQGSIADVYDRLGGQLAQLGQQSRGVKEQKRERAADMQQQMADAQVEYENAVVRAKMAIESGDAEAANAAMQQAYAAQEGIKQAEREFYGNIIGGGATLAGGIFGGPAGAQAGSQIGRMATGGGQQPTPGMEAFSGPSPRRQAQPWSVMRGK
jgi:hypothetical protein